MPRAKRLETDVCILGSGITAAMVAERVTEQSAARVLVLEAGEKIFNLDERFERRSRFLDYGENPWPHDHIRDQTGYGIQSRSMCVGGLGLHWGATTPRFTPEDFRIRSLFGVGADWPIDWEDIEPFYVEAEERMGVAGEPGPSHLDPRSVPYPMAPLPLSYNLAKLRGWAEKSGTPIWANPVAKNSRPYRGRNTCARCDTCTICPTGAKYSPDFTWQELLEKQRAELLDRTLVRRLVAGKDGKIVSAHAVDRATGDEIEVTARIFVVALGYAWTSHLLLLSQIANSSGLVGSYIAGHRAVNAFVEVPFPLYPGVYEMDSLLSKHYQRPADKDRYIRFDLRVWETDFGRQPRLRNEQGELLLGDAFLGDWRERSRFGSARLRGYYDVIPARESRLELDNSRRNQWGDPMFRITLRDDAVSVALRGATEEKIRGAFDGLVQAGGGKVLRATGSDLQDHPAGGCRMGDNPATSVVDKTGRCHDHPNLFIAGAPTMLGAGCNNGTLTFAALSLRTAAAIAGDLPKRRPRETAAAHRAELRG